MGEGGGGGGFGLEGGVGGGGGVGVLRGQGGPGGRGGRGGGSTLHALAMTRYSGLERTGGGWRVIDVDQRGGVRVVGEGKESLDGRVVVRVGAGRVELNGREV